MSTSISNIELLIAEFGPITTAVSPSSGTALTKRNLKEDNKQQRQHELVRQQHLNTERSDNEATTNQHHTNTPQNDNVTKTYQPSTNISATNNQLAGNSRPAVGKIIYISLSEESTHKRRSEIRRLEAILDLQDREKRDLEEVEREGCDCGSCGDCFLAAGCDCEECEVAHEERIRQLEEAYLNGDAVEAVAVNLHEEENEGPVSEWSDDSFGTNPISEGQPTELSEELGFSGTLDEEMEDQGSSGSERARGCWCC